MSKNNYLDLWIDNETDPLEQLVLGTSEGLPSELKPEDCYDPKTLESLVNNSYPNQSDIQREFQKANIILEKHGVEVHRPKKIENCNQMFARDVAFVIEDKLICSNIIPDREEEIHALQERLINRINPKKLINLPDDAHIEGGDVILYDEYIFVGTYRGKDYKQFKTARTNNKAIRMLREYFPHKKIIDFDLQKSNIDPYINILHLDCCFQPVGKGKAIIYPKGFIYEGDYRFLKDFFGEENLFEVSKQEMYLMFPNIFSISPKLVLASEKFTRLIRYMEEKWNITVEKIPCFEISKMGGLLRCTTMPLRRKKKK